MSMALTTLGDHPGNHFLKSQSFVPEEKIQDWQGDLVVKIILCKHACAWVCVKVRGTVFILWVVLVVAHFALFEFLRDTAIPIAIILFFWDPVPRENDSNSVFSHSLTLTSALPHKRDTLRVTCLTIRSLCVIVILIVSYKDASPIVMDVINWGQFSWSVQYRGEWL